MTRYGSKTMNLATRAQMLRFQADLNEIDNIDIEEDGYWGNETETAVRYVQNKANITVDGIAGTYTKLWVYEYSHD